MASEEPSAGASSAAATATVYQRDFSLDYKLDAVTAASDAVRVPLGDGLVWATGPVLGETAAGDVIGATEVAADVRAELQSADSAVRIAAAELTSLEAAAGDVVAPISGPLAMDDAGATIAVPGVDVTVAVTGIQRLRLESIPVHGTATVETVLGQRDVSCAALWIEDADGADDGDLSGVLHCRLPASTQTVPALRATLAVDSDVLTDVLMVPDSAIGTDEDGYTLTLLEDGSETVVPVDVGPSDGVMRVILTDVPVGATVIPPSGS